MNQARQAMMLFALAFLPASTVGDCITMGPASNGSGAVCRSWRQCHEMHNILDFSICSRRIERQLRQEAYRIRSGTLAWLAWRRPGLSRYSARRQGSQEVVAGSSVLPNKRWLVEVAGAYLQRATFE